MYICAKPTGCSGAVIDFQVFPIFPLCAWHYTVLLNYDEHPDICKEITENDPGFLGKAKPVIL